MNQVRRIAVIGASAGVGLAAVRRALDEGLEVSTLSRRIDTLPTDARLHKVHGSSLVLSNVQAAIKGCDAILVTLGTGSSTRATTLCAESARVLLRALKANRSTVPLIVLTGFGAGDSWNYNSLRMKLIFRLFLKSIYADKSRMEQLLTTEYPHWEIVRPGRLTDGPKTGRYRLMRGVYKGMRVGSISREDVAHFMVAESLKSSHLGQYVALSD